MLWALAVVPLMENPTGFFYASSAYIYPEFNTNVSLKESDAWPAQPQDAYGLEKLATEELCKHYTKDFGIECRVGGRKPLLHSVERPLPQLINLRCGEMGYKPDLSPSLMNVSKVSLETVCLMGVIEKYKELAKYNLRQLSSKP